MIDSGALLLTTYLLKELAPSVKFVVTAGRNVVTLTVGGCVSAIKSLTAALDSEDASDNFFFAPDLTTR